jgi:hypothetical protein
MYMCIDVQLYVGGRDGRPDADLIFGGVDSFFRSFLVWLEARGSIDTLWFSLCESHRCWCNV